MEEKVYSKGFKRNYKKYLRRILAGQKRTKPNQAINLGVLHTKP